MGTKITPRSTQVVIYQGDDLELLTHLRQEADNAERLVQRHIAAASSGSARHGDAPSSQEQRQAYNDAVHAAADRAVIVKVQALGRDQFRELVAGHPTRQITQTFTGDDGEPITQKITDPEDAAFGVNVTTFPMALLTFIDAASGRRTIPEPEFATGAELTEFLGQDIADGQFEDLWLAAWAMNRGGGADPKATLYSMDSPNSQ